MWRDDKRHGWFTYKYTNGEVKEAMWNDGQMMKNDEVL
jgi:hypothetical protein